MFFVSFVFFSALSAGSARTSNRPGEIAASLAAEGVAILEFPTFEAAKAWYENPIYSDARKYRLKGADYRAVTLPAWVKLPSESCRVRISVAVVVAPGSAPSDGGPCCPCDFFV